MASKSSKRFCAASVFAIATMLTLYCGTRADPRDQLTGVWEAVVFELGNHPGQIAWVFIECVEGEGFENILAQISIDNLGCTDIGQYPAESECWMKRRDEIEAYGEGHFCRNGDWNTVAEATDEGRLARFPPPHITPPNTKLLSPRHMEIAQLRFTEKSLWLDERTHLYEVIERGDGFLVLELTPGINGGETGALTVRLEESGSFRYLTLDDGRQYVWNPELSKSFS